MAGNVELVVGLIAPIGTNLERVSREISDFLEGAGYGVRLVRISDWFDISTDERRSLGGLKLFERLMNEGDELRRATQRKDVLAAVAVGQIMKARLNAEGRMAVIVRQFKTPEEIVSMQRIYGNRFLAVSCFSRRRCRVDELSRQLADQVNSVQSHQFRGDAESLIKRDEFDSLDEWGQNVRKAFPLSDIFVDVDSHQSFPNSLQRAMEIVFSHPFHTPTRDEFGMNQAEAAALRSSALGRQVGAVITTLGGDIISVGTNEVPRANGGLYWEGDSPDNRDFTLGRDSNDRFKEKLLGEILQKLQTATWLRDDLNRAELATLIDKLIYDNDSVLTGAHVENIIEFGRCVHAEMAAIVDAARRGVSVDGSVLYTTTFPCHECARHIVAAGIRRVVYRVPYPKSLVRELYPDSIDVDGDLCENTHVTFQPFVGIAPRRFRQFFEMRQRKDRRGFVVQWKRDKARPNLGDYVPNYGLIEKDEAEFILEFSGDARE